MFSINDKDIINLERDLKAFARRAYPFATKATLNTAAFGTQKIARNIISGRMIERNKFTRQSIQVDIARTLNVRRQASTVGSISNYMETQEFGGVKTKTGKHGVPIATSEASNEGPKVIPRKRLPTRANKLRNIKLRRTRNKSTSRKQRNKALIMQAAGKGSKHIFLDLGRKAGIFRVMGGKKRPRLRKMYDLSRASVNIPRTPWLKPAFDKATAQLPRLYRRALEFQLKRHGLLKG